MAIVDTTVSPAKPTFRERLRRMIHDMRRSRWAYVFIAPFFILYLVFGFIPQVFSVYLSFSKWTSMGPVEWIGLANFQLAFKDKVFWQAMQNSVIMFFLHVPIMLLLALVLAVLLNSPKLKGYQLFRLIIFLPYITNKVAAGRTFQLLFNSTDQGLINWMLHAVGLGTVPWMDSIWTARITLAIMLIWGWVGYNMILMMAGLQTINPELNEAALIDGASPVQAFWHITIPLMRPMILFCVVMSVMGTFGMFTEVYALTSVGGAVGGPMNATITPLIHMYNKAFGDFRMGYAAALAYIYFIFIFIVTLLQFRRYGRVEQ
jgi:lactose/L-arabinose transport system permease protein